MLNLVVTPIKLEWKLASWFGVWLLLPFAFISEMIADHQIETGLLKPDLKDKVTYTLLRKHRHQTKKSNLRSLADIGKTVSSASRMFTNPDNGNAKPAGRCFLFTCHSPLLHLLGSFLPPLYMSFLKVTCCGHLMILLIHLGRCAILLERFHCCSRLQSHSAWLPRVCLCWWAEMTC